MAKILTGIVAFFWACVCYSGYQTTESIQDAFDEANRSAQKKKTLYITDLDDTLFTGIEFFGGNAWFEAKMEQLKEDSLERLTEPGAFRQTLALWEYLQQFVEVQILDEASYRFLHEAVDNENLFIMANTIRSHRMDHETVRQLADINITFGRLSPTSERYTLDLGRPVHNASVFRNGILYTGTGNSKGEVVLRYILDQGLENYRIIFVDDSLKHVVSVEKVLGEQGIDVQGFHYNQKKIVWDPKRDMPIADVQLEAFQAHRGLLGAKDAEILLEHATPQCNTVAAKVLRGEIVFPK